LSGIILINVIRRVRNATLCWLLVEINPLLNI